MSEVGIGFLFKAASCLPKDSYNKTLTILKSYYLMRCNNISKEYGLSKKLFTSSSRCHRCCIEWSSTAETKVLPLKLTKRQRKRNRLRENNSVGLKYSKKILEGNRLVKTCTFCNHTTTFLVPQKSEGIIEKNVTKTNELTKKEIKKPPVKRQTEAPVNVYCKSKQAFSLINKNNFLKSTIKIEKKEIKNNKKQKDKFAGLCQKAVLSANKIKEVKQNQNKINLFLKPS